jgi:hypothetical protein
MRWKTTSIKRAHALVVLCESAPLPADTRRRQELSRTKEPENVICHFLWERRQKILTNLSGHRRLQLLQQSAAAHRPAQFGDEPVECSVLLLLREPRKVLHAMERRERERKRLWRGVVCWLVLGMGGEDESGMKKM